MNAQRNNARKRFPASVGNIRFFAFLATVAKLRPELLDLLQVLAQQRILRVLCSVERGNKALRRNERGKKWGEDTYGGRYDGSSIELNEKSSVET